MIRAVRKLKLKYDNETIFSHRPCLSNLFVCYVVLLVAFSLGFAQIRRIKWHFFPRIHPSTDWYHKCIHIITVKLCLFRRQRPSTRTQTAFALYAHIVLYRVAIFPDSPLHLLRICEPCHHVRNWISTFYRLHIHDIHKYILFFFLF